MKMKSKYILTGLLTFGVLSSFAQDKLSLQECRDKALEYNKEKKISRLMTDKAGYDVKTYWAKFFPHVEASGNYMFSSNKYKESTDPMQIPTFNNVGGVPTPNGGFVFVPSIPLEFTLNKNWTAGVNVTQPIYMGGRIVSAYRMAKIGRDMSYLNQVLTNNEVVYQTDIAYWNLLKVQELLLAANKYEEVVDRLMVDVTNAYDEGMKSRNDVLKVKVKQNEARLNTRRAENGIKLARMALCHIIGVDLLTEIDIDDSELKLDNLAPVTVKDNILLRPEYQILSKKIEFDSQQIKLARGEYLPQVGVRGGWNYFDALRLNNESLMKGGGFSALISVKVPLFKWGEGINKVKSMKLQHKMTQLQREDATEKMQLEMTMALNQVDESHLEVEMTNEALQSAEENLRMSRDQFEVGLETLADHLEAQTLWQKAWADFIESKAQLKLNETNYLKASGQLYVE